jgi:hypothetical protein
VVENVAAQLVVHAEEAAVKRLRSRPPESLEAYELALRSRKAYREFTREGVLEGKALAERAIAIDPDYAAPWEVLAQCLLQLYIQPCSPDRGTPEMLAKAREAATRAVRLACGFSRVRYIGCTGRDRFDLMLFRSNYSLCGGGGCCPQCQSPEGQRQGADARTH